MNPINHVAIIMDGNGRWGIKNKKSRNLGHKEGLKTVSFSGILGDNLCFSGNDAELPGYVIQIKDGKWTLLDSHAPDPC